MKMVKTVCGMCGGDHCGIDVYLEGDQIVDIKGMKEYPSNRGWVCPQARAAIELAYDPQRLRYPLKRDGNLWRRISWDEALDAIAERLSTIKKEEGAQALAVYQGRALLQFLGAGWPQRFLNLYGSPNLVRNDHMCYIPTTIAEKLTYGATSVYGFDPARVRCLLLWGCNPATSFIPTLWRNVVEAKKKGARLIVVDPRFTQSAARADIYTSIRPGTDLALALGLIHVIIADELYDTEFVERWTLGFELLAERVKEYTPDRVEAITGVQTQQIRQIAETFASIKPACLHIGNAAEHHSNSGQTLRALMILRAITGNLDVPGGNVLIGKIPLADVMLKRKRPAGLKPLGMDRYPLFVEFADFVPGDVLIETLLSGDPYPVKAMVLAGGNPLVTWPNTTQVREAFSRLDFMVVLDMYMTATAKMADIVLPAASSLEKTQLVVRSGHYGVDKPVWYVMLKKPVIEPGERRSDWWFWHKLAQRMGYGKYYPWANVEEAIGFQLRPLGITVKDLEENPSGMYYGARPVYRKYERDGFGTPTGKVELYSRVLQIYGYDPLPEYEEPAESPVSAPQLAQRYPLVLSAGRRVAVYTHSQHRSLPSLRSKEPEPSAEIHPTTAEKHGISDGDWIIVESVRGKIELRAKVTEKICPDVVSLLHGWESANANILTDHKNCDPILACPPLRSSLCSVSKKEQSTQPGE